MAIKNAPPEPILPNIRKQPRAPRQLWRLFGWGSAAAIALTAAALTSQTEAGAQRLQLALAYVSEPVRAVAQIPPHAAETEAETKRLAAQVQELAADRERLTARIATLEHNLDDMTGSIKQQSVQTTAPTADSPPPTPSVPATTAAAIAAAPPPAPALPALAPLPMAPASEAAAPVPPRPQMAEPLPEPVPLPPIRMAAAAPSEPGPVPPPPLKPEFGIDLGGAANIEALRIHWAAMKANYGPVLLGLRQVVSARPRRPVGVDYRLVAGPLPTITAAAQLCARLPVTHSGCRPAKFEGAHLPEH